MNSTPTSTPNRAGARQGSWILFVYFIARPPRNVGDPRGSIEIDRSKQAELAEHRKKLCWLF
jgi:hypothetical protein